MNWIDIASIVFVCVTANHLGLVKAIEDFTGMELPIVNCVKCSTWWCAFFYTLSATHAVILPLAISFLASYSAIWLELLEGYIDILYIRLYEKIYSDTENDTTATDAGNGHSAGSVS